MLWMYQRVFYGKVTNPKNSTLSDIDARERVSLWPLAIAALVMGVAPNLWLHSIDPSVSAALRQFSAGTQATPTATYDVRAPGSQSHPGVARLMVDTGAASTSEDSVRHNAEVMGR